MLEDPATRQETSTRCLVHEAPPADAVRDKSLGILELGILEQPSPSRCGKLKRDWSGYALRSPLAREIEAGQRNCSLPVATFHLDNNAGLGSHLHQWTQAACNAHEKNYRLRTFNPEWLWLDQTYCDAKTAVKSPFLCYFPTIEYRCGVEESDSLSKVNVSSWDDRCIRMQQKGFLTEFRAAAVEYIFQQV